MTGHERQRLRERAVALRAQGVAIPEIARRLSLSSKGVVALVRVHRARNCEFCGQRFTPNSGHQRFCSTAHQRAASGLGPKPRHCRLCGEPFVVDGRSGRRYCDPEHRDKAREAWLAANSVARCSKRIRRLEAELERVRAQLGEQGAA
jgi:uncharacterized small protein (DUF1192 family)